MMKKIKIWKLLFAKLLDLKSNLVKEIFIHLRLFLIQKTYQKLNKEMALYLSLHLLELKTILQFKKQNQNPNRKPN